jgi:hypothetical protein
LKPVSHFIGSRVETRRFQAYLWVMKPGYHFIGSRVGTRRFQALGQLDSTCTAPPRERTFLGERRGGGLPHISFWFRRWLGRFTTLCCVSCVSCVSFSLMINSDCVRILTRLFVRFRVDTTSSAAFLLRERNDDTRSFSFWDLGSAVGFRSLLSGHVSVFTRLSK